MKLLDWMQHKFRQTNNDNITEFAPRKSYACITDLQYYPKSHCYAKATSNNTERKKHFRKSFACIETARKDNELNEQDFSNAQVVFHGFLAIGTLAITEPETPTFATSVENITWKETEATENELKLINGELEKVLRTGEKEEEGVEKTEDKEVVCPLQSYLFGSVVESPVKKEQRASLGELFQRTKMEEEEEEEYETTQPKNNNIEKRKDKSAVHLMKKILKGTTLYPSSRSKFQRMFQRKVHPEEPKCDDGTSFPLVDTSKRGAKFCMSDSDGNKECWIKSDTEYLVLEVKGKKGGM